MARGKQWRLAFSARARFIPCALVGAAKKGRAGARGKVFSARGRIARLLERKRLRIARPIRSIVGSAHLVRFVVRSYPVYIVHSYVSVVVSFFFFISFFVFLHFFSFFFSCFGFSIFVSFT